MSSVPKPHIKKLKPQCINHENMDIAQCLGHSAEGYVLPCCFIDAYPLHRGYAQETFYQEKFKISNVDNIEQITHSKEWVEFYIMLQQQPNEAPPICFKKCSEDSVGDKYGEE